MGVYRYKVTLDMHSYLLKLDDGFTVIHCTFHNKELEKTYVF